jgi:hypothetical protein
LRLLRWNSSLPYYYLGGSQLRCHSEYKVKNDAMVSAGTIMALCAS